MNSILHENLFFLLAGDFYGRIQLTKFQMKYGKYIA